ncbi:MAG: hypothetical protein IJL74_03190 [Bacilli bacterium]|nr:hypothetical protein [Bacilli bacterium]
MIQILLGWASIGFGILAGLFGTVARIYDIMLKLTGYYSDGGVPDNFIITTTNVMTTMYTLAGVFMLFRVTLSMINFLIEPDKLNDAQAGPAKMITRIITSLAMLLLFVPNGWIFNKNPDDPGILMRIERALLAEDGLINNILPEVNGEKGTLSKSNSKNELFVDNVYAVNSNQGYDCYYVYITASSQNIANKNGGNTPKSEKSITHMLHLTLYPDTETGVTNKLCSGKLGGCDYSFTSDSSSPYEADFGVSVAGGLWENGAMNWPTLENGWPSKHNCPNVIEEVGGGRNKASDGYGNASSWEEVYSRYVGGWHSAETMMAAVQKSGIPAAGSNAETISESLGISAENSFLFGVSNEAIQFAQSALSSFIECNGDSECEPLKEKMLMSNVANKDIENALDDDNSAMTLDFVIGMVAGIGLVVWIAVLCVEVIIRRFKLILLEIMAPIPIISYVDPNDKIFKRWGEMYILTYLDLFLKLIAISFAIVLLKSVSTAVEGSGLLLFFYIIAILLFAKMIPTMISKIFGIEVGSGSFKEITDMGKKAIGMTAGAAIGVGAGLVSGIKAYGDYRNLDSVKQSRETRKNAIAAARQGDDSQKQWLKDTRKDYLKNDVLNSGVAFGKTVLGGTFSGFFRGARSGVSGKPFEGGSSVATDNKGYIDRLRQDGIKPTKVLAEGIISKFRVGKPTDKVEEKLNNIKALQEITKSMQGFADDFESAVKKIPAINDLAKLNSQGLITDNDFKNILTNVGQQMNSNRNADGTYNGDAALNIDHLGIRDRDGREISLGDFKAGAYAKGVDTAEQKMQTFIDAIKTNPALAQALSGQGLDLNTLAKGFKNVQDIKLSTYDAMRELDKDEIRITNSKEYQELKALEKMYYSDNK